MSCGMWTPVALRGDGSLRWGSGVRWPGETRLGASDNKGNYWAAPQGRTPVPPAGRDTLEERAEVLQCSCLTRMW